MVDKVCEVTDIRHEKKRADERPYYNEVANEVAFFEAAWRSELAVMLKGPTGCGKTRLVEHMAHKLNVPLFTVSCNEDTTSSDLLGRFILKGGDTVWVDGPLTRAVREGGICYLDEVVEARQDAIVAIHSLTDYRRELNIERLGGQNIKAKAGFTLVISYNPGYQSILKDLKMSTRQRMVAIELDFPTPDVEREILMTEVPGLTEKYARDLVALGQTIRRTQDDRLLEAASTRMLVAAGKMIVIGGICFREAVIGAVNCPLSDDPDISLGLQVIVDSFIG